MGNVSIQLEVINGIQSYRIHFDKLSSLTNITSGRRQVKIRKYKGELRQEAM